MKTNRNLITKCLLVVAFLPALAGKAQPTVSAIAAGAGFSLFLKSDGNLWAMGDNLFGELGDGHQRYFLHGCANHQRPGAAFFKLQ